MIKNRGSCPCFFALFFALSKLRQLLNSSVETRLLFHWCATSYINSGEVFTLPLNEEGVPERGREFWLCSALLIAASTVETFSFHLSSLLFDNAALSHPAGRDLAALPATDCCRHCLNFANCSIHQWKPDSSFTGVPPPI